MNALENQSMEKPAENFTKTWRYKFGILTFIVGNVGVIAAMPVGVFLGFGVVTIGAIVVCSEVLATSSINSWSFNLFLFLFCGHNYLHGLSRQLHLSR